MSEQNQQMASLHMATKVAKVRIFSIEDKFKPKTRKDIKFVANQMNQNFDSIDRNKAQLWKDSLCENSRILADPSLLIRQSGDKNILFAQSKYRNSKEPLSPRSQARIQVQLPRVSDTRQSLEQRHKNKKVQIIGPNSNCRDSQQMLTLSTSNDELLQPIKIQENMVNSREINKQGGLAQRQNRQVNLINKTLDVSTECVSRVSIPEYDSSLIAEQQHQNVNNPDSQGPVLDKQQRTSPILFTEMYPQNLNSQESDHNQSPSQNEKNNKQAIKVQRHMVFNRDLRQKISKIVSSEDKQSRSQTKDMKAKKEGLRVDTTKDQAHLVNNIDQNSVQKLKPYTDQHKIEKVPVKNNKKTIHQSPQESLKIKNRESSQAREQVSALDTNEAFTPHVALKPIGITWKQQDVMQQNSSNSDLWSPMGIQKMKLTDKNRVSQYNSARENTTTINQKSNLSTSRIQANSDLIIVSEDISHHAGNQTNFELISPTDVATSPDFDSNQILKVGVYPPQIKVESKRDSSLQKSRSSDKFNALNQPKMSQNDQMIEFQQTKLAYKDSQKLQYMLLEQQKMHKLNLQTMKSDSMPQILSLKESVKAPRKLGNLNLLSKRYPQKNQPSMQRQTFKTQGRNRYRSSVSNMLINSSSKSPIRTANCLQSANNQLTVQRLAQLQEQRYHQEVRESKNNMEKHMLIGGDSLQNLAKQSYQSRQQSQNNYQTSKQPTNGSNFNRNQLKSNGLTSWTPKNQNRINSLERNSIFNQAKKLEKPSQNPLVLRNQDKQNSKSAYAFPEQSQANFDIKSYPQMQNVVEIEISQNNFQVISDTNSVDNQQTSNQSQENQAQTEIKRNKTLRIILGSKSQKQNLNASTQDEPPQFSVKNQIVETPKQQIDYNSSIQQESIYSTEQYKNALPVQESHQQESFENFDTETPLPTDQQNQKFDDHKNANQSIDEDNNTLLLKQDDQLMQKVRYLLQNDSELSMMSGQCGEQSVEKYFGSESGWRSFVKDELNLLKCRTNLFGKQYNLGIDRGQLSQHIALILKANIKAKVELSNKPVLTNQSIKTRQKAKENLRKAKIPYQTDFHNKQAILEHKAVHGKYRSRQQDGGLRKNSEPTAAVNLTTLAQWQRHASQEDISQQVSKLQALNIEKLNIDYKIVNRNSIVRELMMSEKSQSDSEEEENYKGSNGEIKEKIVNKLDINQPPLSMIKPAMNEISIINSTSIYDSQDSNKNLQFSNSIQQSKEIAMSKQENGNSIEKQGTFRLNQFKKRVRNKLLLDPSVSYLHTDPTINVSQHQIVPKLKISHHDQRDYESSLSSHESLPHWQMSLETPEYSVSDEKSGSPSQPNKPPISHRIMLQDSKQAAQQPQTIESIREFGNQQIQFSNDNVHETIVFESKVNDNQSPKLLESGQSVQNVNLKKNRTSIRPIEIPSKQSFSIQGPQSTINFSSQNRYSQFPGSSSDSQPQLLYHEKPEGLQTFKLGSKMLRSNLLQKHKNSLGANSTQNFSDKNRYDSLRIITVPKKKKSTYLDTLDSNGQAPLTDRKSSSRYQTNVQNPQSCRVDQLQNSKAVRDGQTLANRNMIREQSRYFENLRQKQFSQFQKIDTPKEKKARVLLLNRQSRQVNNAYFPNLI